ncbi:pyrimidine/purine nucleoside phosphorylase [Neptunicella sp. SCSIO 80796]|uniref:pyrimidine/purine nucleoside phosphorylase n=1 Tax=Neptunicella plasticusilytica TaxID=3117012 RepID=UPI003A4D5641
MSKFDNVTLIRDINVYFDGGVTSRTVVFTDGSTKTLGVMNPGEYEFGTAKKELMEIQSGDLDVMLPGHTEWQNVKGGQEFRVSANAKFQVKVNQLTDYCCSYLD